ncbi:MAG TPA: prepilin-type N-terminal cleavage/methylation domain-containing protein [Candidatus Saccharimonadales bacterium]|nr:prepilin-type N-terminal cleavage/methylation domain-containing protein [Candidatus Saccharimonadales bacterium]
MKRTSVADSRGFTVLELLAVVVLIGGFLALATFLLRPRTHDAERRNAQRWLGTAEIMQGITRYHDATGALPGDLPAQPQAIASTQGAVNLCSDLVPAYLKDLPFDPILGYNLAGSGHGCAGSLGYVTGYTIAVSGANKVTVEAPAAELDAHISLSRQF